MARPVIRLYRNNQKNGKPRNPDWIGRGHVELAGQFYPAVITAWSTAESISLYVNIEDQGIFPEPDEEQDRDPDTSGLVPPSAPKRG